MKKKSNKEFREAKIRAMQQIFYEDLCIYMLEEYSPRTCRLFFDSPISDDIVHLVNDYFWGGNTIQFTAGQIADLLKSKYPKKNK
jgi:hypothetical protein